MLRTRTDHVSYVAQMLSNEYTVANAQLVTDNDLRWTVKDYYKELQEKLETHARENSEFREIADALQRAKASLANFEKD